MNINEAPGQGVDINEKLAVKYSLSDLQLNNRIQIRKNDGTKIRP
jgi:mannonate dehydratase